MSEYGPTPEELMTDLGIEHTETDGVIEQTQEGRPILRTETHGETQQATQFEYGPQNSSVENGKLLSGPEQGKMLRREHPNSEHLLELNVGGKSFGAPVRLETLGQTIDGETTGKEPWAHFDITDEDTIMGFAELAPKERQVNDAGEHYVLMRGNYGGGQRFKVGNREVLINAITKISVVFDTNNERPIRVTLGGVQWEYAPESAGS